MTGCVPATDALPRFLGCRFTQPVVYDEWGVWQYISHTPISSLTSLCSRPWSPLSPRQEAIDVLPGSSLWQFISPFVCGLFSPLATEQRMFCRGVVPGSSRRRPLPTQHVSWGSTRFPPPLRSTRRSPLPPIQPADLVFQLFHPLPLFGRHIYSMRGGVPGTEIWPKASLVLCTLSLSSFHLR
jgi:hypothetical protein